MRCCNMNTIIEWPVTQHPRYDRILYVDPNGSTVVVIDVTNIDGDDAVNPVYLSYDAIEEALKASNARIMDTDPYMEKLRPKADLSADEKDDFEKLWKVIKPIVTHKDVFIPSVRGKLISHAAKSSGFNPKLVRRYVKRYWRGGQIQQAVFPRYYRCGTGRKKDKAKDYKKLGRPVSSTGVNMDPVAEEHFMTGIKLYFLNEKGRSLRYAYKKTIATFFYRGKYEKHGVKVPLLPASDEVPSYDQFLYVYRKSCNVVDVTLARDGQRSFDLTDRAIPGNSTLDADGLGSIAQLDWTLGDVHLVSEFDRSRKIGRPVIYILSDVFSHAIMALGVGLDAPSWLGVRLLLENAVRNKVDYCREYGYTITEADWPCQHLPKAIVGDRGEMLSKNSDFLTRHFKIEVVNTPPYRPDWKAIVERHFRLLDDFVIDWVPGAIPNYPERGGPDYELDACLTLHELRQLLIGCIIEHNIAHKIKDYPRDKDMIADGVQAYPAQLWNWGVINRRGRLTEKPPAMVHVKLLEEEKATVTPEGIRFKGLYYECDLAWKERWFAKARITKRWSIPAAYDRRTTKRIYLRLDEGRQIEECRLMPKDQMWADFDWQDIKDRRELEKILAIEPDQRAPQIQIEIQTKQEEIIRDAQKKTKVAKKGISKADLKRGISEYRAEERRLEHEKDHLLHSAVTTSPNPTSTSPTQEEVEEDAFFKAERARWLRKNRDEGSDDAK